MSDKQPFYNNPVIPEGINTSKAHPIATFIKLFGAIAIILAFSAWLLAKSGDYLASLIPYSQEVTLAQLYEAPESSDSDMQLYLENLSEYIVDAMELPEGMDIHLHYVNEDVDNAFATIGGHIFIYKGLLSKLPNENAIAMVIAHEIAHVKHRDPVRSLGQNLAISTGFALLLGKSNVNLLGSAGLYTQLKFNRDMETSSDIEGLKALVNAYGHANGATDLFKVLSSLSDDDLIKESTFFVTHPLGENRIKKIEAMAKENNWSMDKATKALPEHFEEWLTAED
ncbi:MAG TPA: hypothetical protein EYG68_06690 [Leucothrix mucor]|nr:hypothetical protein [Leucothrix mucor]